ncbi:hypothetical protein ACFYKX_10340 [Cytobacillus sp. FJAT-54145]|uniref:Uncharacterized protein n=1 Tax=Cytobacillus spartinae TaxID=3299023 RepID=A0ABW6KCN1_9BACI
MIPHKPRIILILGILFLLCFPVSGFAAEQTSTKFLPANIDPSVRIGNQEALFSTLFVLFPPEVFEHAQFTSQSYIENPNIPYQNWFDHHQQNLYYRVTFPLEANIQKALIHESMALGVPHPYFSDEAFQALSVDKQGVFTYLWLHSTSHIRAPFLR